VATGEEATTPGASATAVDERFRLALDALVARLREDRSILAAILCGSLSHDRVWAGSDIDLVLLTVDDRKIEESSHALYADGVNVHAMLLPRARFRQAVDGALASSFVHSFLAKGRLLYTHDASIAALCERLGEIGGRDTQLQLLRAATAALAPLYKARKWLVTRGDLEYTALWILHAATPLARVEVIGRRLIADREVLPQAMALHPAFFRTVYVDLLNEPKSRPRVEGALAAAEGYLAERAPTLFESHFARHLGVEGVTAACEYLADQGLVGKASAPVRLTVRSNVAVEELAFYHLDRDDRAAVRPTASSS
jgi:hypothetical protein